MVEFSEEDEVQGNGGESAEGQGAEGFAPAVDDAPAQADAPPAAEAPPAPDPEPPAAEAPPAPDPAPAAEAPPAPDPAPPVAESPQPSAYPKADLSKRLIAAIVDAVVAVAVGFIPLVGGLVATAYWLVRDGLEIDFMDGRSIGKKLVQIRPVRLDGQPMDIATSVKRNWMFALGGVSQLLAMTIIGLILAIPLALLVFLIAIVELVLVLTDAQGRRLGDKFADTQVIDADS